MNTANIPHAMPFLYTLTALKIFLQWFDMASMGPERAQCFSKLCSSLCSKAMGTGLTQKADTLNVRCVREGRHAVGPSKHFDNDNIFICQMGWARPDFRKFQIKLQPLNCDRAIVVIAQLAMFAEVGRV